MKKLASVLAIGLSLTLLAGCNGGGNTPAPAEVTLSSIAISGAKTEYVVGDAFVKPTVTATYSDQTTKVVTNEAQFSGFNSASAVTSQAITATYTEKNVTKTATYTVSIIALPEGENTIEATIADVAKGYGWTEGTKYSSFKLDTVVTVSSTGGENTGKYYAATTSQSDTYRLYASENAKLTISVSGDHVLKSVTLDWYVKDNGAVQGMTKNVAKDVTGKTSVDFTITSSSGNKGKIFISAITVVYYGEAGGDPFVRDDWTATEKTILSENFYGIDLPFVYFKGIQLIYDDYNEEYYVEVDNVKLADYRTYVAAFEASTAWENIDEEVSANNANYIGVKATADGNRYVTANIYLINDDTSELIDNEEDAGTLYIDLGDPYYYEWSNELFASAFDYYGIKTTATLVEVDNFEYFFFDENEFTIYIPGQQETALAAYKDKLVGWTTTDIKTITEDEGTEDEYSYKEFTAIPASNDLFLKVDYYGEGVLAITAEKYLPHLTEFPMAAVKEYNGGFEVDVIAGADYFTGEEIMGVEINYEAESYEDLYIEVPLYYEVVAYGIDATEFATFKTTLETNCLKVTKYDVVDDNEQVIEGIEGYSVEMLLGTRYYNYTLEYDTENEVVTFHYLEDPETSYSATWISDVIAEFLSTVFSITDTVPELPLGSASGYFYSVSTDVEDSACVAIRVSRLAEEEWLGVLRTAGWTVPATPSEEWGYECRNAQNTIEVDIDQDEDNGVTYAFIYSAAWVDGIGE